jgi:hypothetical protein
MYPVERTFTPDEAEIIFRIRQLTGDEKEVYVDDITEVGQCSTVKASGTLYQLEEPKGYPREIYVNGVEYASTSGATGVQVLSYKFLQFVTPIVLGDSLVVIYDHFNESDAAILDVYDTSATTYLVAQCNLEPEDLSIDLLVLATAFVLLSKELVKYTKDALKIEDSDSVIDASRRPQYLRGLLDLIKNDLKDALEMKLKCKMLSLPVYKVE